MRRGWVVCCSLVALGAAAAFAAEGAGDSGSGPSLEYRPPKPILPEPKGPTPAPPVTIFRESFGNFGIGRGSFDKPRDVAFDPDRRMFVLDAGNSRVQMFDRSNNFLLEWGTEGTDERLAQFKNPSAIAVLPQSAAARRAFGDVVLVVDTDNNRIQWFKIPGQLANFPVGHASSVFRTLGRDYGVLGEYGIGDGKFNRPVDIAFEEPLPHGTAIWVLDAGNQRVQRFFLTFDQAKGAYLFPPVYVSQISNLTGARGNLKDLVSLTLSREGSFDYLYLLGTGCAVQKFKFTGPLALPRNLTLLFDALTPLAVLDAAWPAVAPESGLCVSERVRYDREKEFVYVLDSGNGLLSIFHRGGNYISALRGADRTFDEPAGFTFIPESGEFAVADTGNDLVQKFTLR